MAYHKWKTAKDQFSLAKFYLEKHLINFILSFAQLCADFLYPRCKQGKGVGNERRQEENIGIKVNYDIMEELQQICYLGDLWDCEVSVER